MSPCAPLVDVALLMLIVEVAAQRAGSRANQCALVRFGASLNRHVQYRCCVIGGVFAPAEDAADVSESVRDRPAGH